MEELTSPEVIKDNPLCERTISLYGYVRGACMKAHSHIHIPGQSPIYLVADMSISF